MHDNIHKLFSEIDYFFEISKSETINPCFLTLHRKHFIDFYTKKIYKTLFKKRSFSIIRVGPYVRLEQIAFFR